MWPPRHRSSRGSRPDGRTYAPREEVEPERQMTTRGYEHRSAQASGPGGPVEGCVADELGLYSRDHSGRPLLGGAARSTPKRGGTAHEAIWPPKTMAQRLWRSRHGLPRGSRPDGRTETPRRGGESLDTDVDPRVRASRRTPGPEGPYEGREADELDLCSRDHTGGTSHRTKGRLVPVRA